MAYRFIIVTLLAGIGLVTSMPVSAQESETEVEIFAVTQEDLNQDGAPDLTIIDSAFITERDRVLVYDRGRDMKVSESWEQATDFENDLWAFDAAADGQVELVIDFRESAEGLVALLWDDQDGDGTVAYEPAPQPSVLESQFPTVEVVAPDGWWVRSGKINFNLDLTVDGQVQASFSAKPWLDRVETDGEVDFSIQVRDTDEDGRPNYQWVDAWPEAPSGYGIRRTEIAVNPSDDEPSIEGAIFWPLLGSTLDWDGLKEDRPSRLPAESLHILQPRSGYNKYYRVSMPPIQMLWQKAALLYVGEFVASRFNDDTWFAYSTHRVRPNEISAVNFEAPFAFYDLGADDDGYPELAIRFEQYLKRDPFFIRRRNPEPVQILRYSWDQDNNTSWDYKLHLIGRHPITDTVEVGDLVLRMVSPSILPSWTTKQAWDGATMVVAEGKETWTSEGIYEWGIHGYWRDEYVTGISDVRPSVDDLSELAVGQRGEYAFDLQRQPTLYLSPVDYKLHLLGAEGGVWKLDESREIHYANLGGDYLNEWTLVEDGTAVKSISFVSDYILYENQTGVQFMRTDRSAAEFLAMPPTNNIERLRLGRQLQSYQHDFLPWDFEALALQTGNSRLRVDGASIRDLRLTDQGFRLVLDLQPGFRAAGSLETMLKGVTPGPYLLTYDESFTVRPLTPADLALSVDLSSEDNLHVGIPVSIRTEAINRGLADAKNLSLVVQAQQGNDSFDIARRNVDVLAESPTQSTFTWKPPGPGRWEIRATLMNAPGRIVVSESTQTFGVTPLKASAERIFLLSVGGERQTVPLLMAVTALMATLTGVLWLALRSRRESSPAQSPWSKEIAPGQADRLIVLDDGGSLIGIDALGSNEYRAERPAGYKLIDILLIATCAARDGAETWTDVELYGKRQQKWLRQFVELNSGVPTHETFDRVFAHLDIEAVGEFTRSWPEDLFTSQNVQAETTIEDEPAWPAPWEARSSGKGGVNMVRAWTAADHLFLGRLPGSVEEDGGDTIGQFLPILALQGHTVTTGTEGCRTAIAQRIVEQGADYVLAVPETQTILFADLTYFFELAEDSNFHEFDHDYHRINIDGHGRHEICECWSIAIAENPTFLRNRSKWSGLQTAAMVRLWRQRDGEMMSISRFYISSLDNDARRILQAAANHWVNARSLQWLVAISSR